MSKARIVAGIALAATIVAGSASAATAHVTIQPATAEKGTYGRFVFRVPNESATASTIKLDVQFPQDKPLRGVRVQPMQGWDVALTKAPLAEPIKTEGGEITEYVSQITWTAQPGFKIGPDQFEEFGFTVGPLPKDQDSFAVKAIQTYDAPLADGTTEARWVEVREEGKDDPKRPEALVKLTEPKAAEGTAGATTAAATGTGESAATPADAGDTANTARTMAIFGLILGAIAVLLAGAALVSKGKREA